MKGFRCSPIRSVESEAECLKDDKKADEFYRNDNIHARTEDCNNYFNVTKTVAYWPVSLKIKLLIQQSNNVTTTDTRDGE